MSEGASVPPVPGKPEGTEAAAGGDHDAFLKLLASAQPALQHFLAAHIPDLHEVDDLMQETAVCLWKKFAQFVPGTSFRSWAIRVAQYEVLHARRSHARQRTLFLPALAEAAAQRYSDLDAATVETRRQALERCLEKLPSGQRDLILARYRSERSCQELAQEWGRTENHVWVQLFRIRAALRQCVEGTLGVARSGSGEVTA